MEKVERIVWDDFPEESPDVEFRLVYEGPLKAAGRAGTRVSEKHTIRKQLHKQLKYLWQAMPQLAMRTKDHLVLNPGRTTWDANKKIQSRSVASSDIQQSLLVTLGNSFERCGYKFVPLVNNRLKLYCGLDVIFLRRDMPGAPLIRSGGDIDNRLKVLFDALRIPENCEELTGATKESDEDPYFYCLLEDDALISELTVTTDTLLTPYEAGQESDVHLIIKVKVRPFDFSFETVGFI